MSLPIHITGMENIKGQQYINAVLDNMNKELDNHKWTITTQDFARLSFEKYLESGSQLSVDQKPKTNVPIVGTHNNRKVYIGDLDVQGNLIIKNLALRDNVNTVAKSWEVRMAPYADGNLIGDEWNSESFQVGIRNPLPLNETLSIPNDISDPTYGEKIINGESTTIYGTSLDTKTFEKSEMSYYIKYPEWEAGSGTPSDPYRTIFALDAWIDRGWTTIEKRDFPRITTLNAPATWANGQWYGLFEWEDGRVRMLQKMSFSTYSAFYSEVAARQSGNIGLMIPSWRFIDREIHSGCVLYGQPVITRRFVSEEFDKRNSGIVKVDVSYRV